jgi:hypothetical protein
MNTTKEGGSQENEGNRKKERRWAWVSARYETCIKALSIENKEQEIDTQNSRNS